MKIYIFKYILNGIPGVEYVVSDNQVTAIEKAKLIIYWSRGIMYNPNQPPPTIQFSRIYSVDVNNILKNIRL